MSEPILDTRYWAERLRNARNGDLHHAVFRCSLDQWLKIEAKHREILAAHIQPMDSILDVGCGYGRLLTMMPREWHGLYLGVDISPDFVALAREWHPGKGFIECNMTDLSCIKARFDVAILISIRPMVRRNLGDDVWQHMEQEIRRVASKMLFLEYDPSDEGSVE